MCVPFSQCRAVVTEQTKKQLRPQIILGQMRWWCCCLQSKALPKTEANPLQCYSWFDSWHFGVSDLAAGHSEMAGPLAARGHGRAATADSAREHQVPGPASLSNLQSLLFAPGPVAVLAAPQPTLARLLAPEVRLQVQVSPCGGFQGGTGRCSAELPSLLCLLGPRLPASLSGADGSQFIWDSRERARW